MVHGLAANIRAAKENEVFDLAGLSATTISSTIAAAFGQPFDDDNDDLALTTMIRLTFVVGAGKQARQKYDDGAQRAVISALEAAGYTHDRTASSVLECAGCYKLQHDTAKNLKTIVVYPRIQSKALGRQGGNEQVEEEALIPEHTPGYKLAVASMPTFTNIIQSKCPSWSQKKGCLECLEALQNIIQSLEDKLVQGQPLSTSEQAFYNVVANLDEKMTWVKQVSKQQVEEGQITELEKNILLEQNAQRLQEEPTNVKLLERQKLLQSIVPISPRPLKHALEIAQLQKEVVQLLPLNDNQLLSVKERQLVTRREQIWQEIANYEEASRGWFEDDDVFAVRLQASRDGLDKFRSKSAKISSATSAMSSKTAPKKGKQWILPSEQQKGSKKKKANRPTGSDVFGAMRIKQGLASDSSSDDDEDEDDDDEDVEPEEETNIATIKTTAAKSSKSNPESDNQSNSKKSKKKKKKGKPIDSEDAALEIAARQAQAAANNDEYLTALGQLWRFLSVYIFPLIVGLITWIVRLLFGKPKTKEKKS